MDRIENDTSNNHSIIACVFVAAVTYLPISYLATIRMHAVEMGSCAMIYIPSFINTDSGIQKLIRGYSQTQTARRSHKPTFIFST
jgi:hypothetical protein